MPLRKVRFTLRSLLVAVALVALNLGGAIASPRKDWSEQRYVSGVGSYYRDGRPEYGLTCVYDGNARQTNGRIIYKLWSVGRGLSPLTLLQAWSPVIASVSITLLVLAVRFWDAGTVRRSNPPQSGGVAPTRRPRERLALRLMAIIIAMIALTFISSVFRPIAFVYRLSITVVVFTVCLWDWGERWHRMRLLARWVIIVTALIALNLVGAVAPPPLNLYEIDWTDRLPRPPRGFGILFAGDFRPSPPLPPQPIEPSPGTHLDLNYSDLFDGIPRVLNLSIDGTLVQRCAMEMDGRMRLPEVLFQDTPIGEATIDFRADGSVAGNAGRPGKLLSQARVLRLPSVSFLELHWPVIASASLTIVFLVLTVRHLPPRQIRTLLIVVALAGINLAGVFASPGMEQPRLLSATWGHDGGGEAYYSDGSRHISNAASWIPWHVTRIEQPNPPPTFLQTWWPIMTSAGVTLLVLGMLWRRARRRSIEAANPIDSGPGPSAGSQRLAGDSVVPG